MFIVLTQKENKIEEKEFETFEEAYEEYVSSTLRFQKLSCFLKIKETGETIRKN